MIVSGFSLGSNIPPYEYQSCTTAVQHQSNVLITKTKKIKGIIDESERNSQEFD